MISNPLSRSSIVDQGRYAELAAGRVEQAHDTSLVSDIGFIFDVILHGRTGGWIDIRGRLLLNHAVADDRRVRRRWTTRSRILCARAASKT
jgi:hypothetical protein